MSSSIKLRCFLLTLCFWCFATSGVRADFTRDLIHLKQRWAEVNYQLKGKTQLAAFTQLMEDADETVAERPRSAEALIWSGIIKSSYADAKGGFGAFKVAKRAKADLEAAIAIDPDAMNGAAYVTLGTLYYKVLRWPLSFGDDQKAEQLLRYALELDPDGIDSNYAYGSFLVDEERYDEARRYLLRALRAPARPGYVLADGGRQDEIRAALDFIAQP